MQWVKAEANTEAMKVVRVDCGFVMPKLGQSKRKVRHRMKNSQQGLEKHLCWLRLCVSSMFIVVTLIFPRLYLMQRVKEGLRQPHGQRETAKEEQRQKLKQKQRLCAAGKYKDRQ